MKLNGLGGAARGITPDPIAPLLILSTTLVVSVGLEAWALVWIALAALAGHSLSGSTWSFNSADALASPGRRGTKIGRETMAWLGVGLVAGGMLTGFLVWVAGGLMAWVPVPLGHYIVGLAALAIVLRDLDVVSFPLPAREWQVPKSVLDRDARQAALGFGFQLGLGFRTYVSASAPYLLVAALVFLAASLPVCMVSGAAFGIGRLAMALERYLSTYGEAWNSLMDSRAGLIRKATAVATALGASALTLA